MGDFIEAPDDFSIDDVPDDIPIVDVQTRADSAIEAATKAYQRELDRHLLGAWMAGFEALDVITPYGQPPHAGEDVFDPAVPAITGRVRPVEDADRRPSYPDGYRVERYDLRDVDPEDVREARGESDA